MNIWELLRCGLVIGGLGLGSAKAEERAFTDTKGRTITASLISATEDKVTIKRSSNGKEYTLDLSKLSEGDQAFIKKWREENPEAAAPKDPVIGEVKFEYRISKKKTNTRKLGKDRSVEKWLYEVELTNKDRNPIPKITAKYELFVRYYDKHADPKRGVARTETGEYVIKGIEGNGRYKFQTKVISAETNKSRTLNGDIVTSYQYEEDLEGVILQFYQGEKKIGEHSYGRTKRN